MAAANIQVLRLEVRLGVNTEAEVLILIEHHFHVKVGECWRAYHFDSRGYNSMLLARLPNIHREFDVVRADYLMHFGLEGSEPSSEFIC